MRIRFWIPEVCPFVEDLEGHFFCRALVQLTKIEHQVGFPLEAPKLQIYVCLAAADA
jgi:hypothetical protein